VLIVFLLLPLIGVIFLNLIPKKTGRKISFYINLLIISLQIILSIFINNIAGMSAPFLSFFESIIKKLYYDIFSIISLFTIGLVSFISLIINRYSKNENRSDDFNFNNLILLLITGMNGIVLIHDMFSLYIFLEITSVSTFILISLDKSILSLEGSFKYFIMSAIATMFLLVSIAFIFISVGSLNYSDISLYLQSLNNNYPITITIVFICFIVGMSIKAGLVPFHGWLPDAYSSAPTPVSIMLAGIVTKITGVYTLIRLIKDVFSKLASIEYILLTLGVISILIGCFGAIGQKKMKRMLSYSSISQVGYIILGAALSTPLGYIGALLHFFNHAVFKSLLFVNTGAVEQATGTEEMKKLGGLSSKMPVTGITSIIGFLSTAGVPPLSGFWSKLIIIIALWQAGYIIIAVIVLTASILTLAYLLIIQRNVFFGILKEGLENIKDGNFAFIFSSIILSLITIILGIAFPFILKYLE